MNRTRVRYSRQYDSFHVENAGDVLLQDHDHATGPLEVLGIAGLTSLRTAMMDVYEQYEFGSPDELADLPIFSVTWSSDPADAFDDDLSLSEPVSLALMRDGRLLLELIVAVGPPPRSYSDTWPMAAALLEPWLSHRGAKLASITVGGLGFRWYWTIRVEMPLRGRTVLDAHELGSETIQFLGTYAEGTPTLDGLRALLRSGHAQSLVGMSENQLLEAKRALHLEDERNCLELAKDVSAIANSLTGGLVVFGLGTVRRAGRDVIVGVHPMRDTGQARRIRSVIDRLVYPPIQKLDVALVPHGPSSRADEHLVVLTVPPQPRELLPFLVTGLVAGNRVMGSYIGLFERRGEDTHVSGPASIHAGLSVGLALLRHNAEQGT